jgi:hypothetical protein
MLALHLHHFFRSNTEVVVPLAARLVAQVAGLVAAVQGFSERPFRCTFLYFFFSSSLLRFLTPSGADETGHESGIRI